MLRIRNIRYMCTYTYTNTNTFTYTFTFIYVYITHTPIATKLRNNSSVRASEIAARNYAHLNCKASNSTLKVHCALCVVDAFLSLTQSNAFNFSFLFFTCNLFHFIYLCVLHICCCCCCCFFFIFALQRRSRQIACAFRFVGCLSCCCCCCFLLISSVQCPLRVCVCLSLSPSFSLAVLYFLLLLLHFCFIFNAYNLFVISFAAIRLAFVYAK